MARRTPKPPTGPGPTGQPGPAPDRPEPGPEPEEAEFGAWLGERLRRVALGLTAALISARFYWPSEYASEADTGGGLPWIEAMLAAAGLGIAALLIGGKARLRWSWTDAAVYALMLLVGLSSIRGAERRVAINLAWEWAGLGVAYAMVRLLPRTRGESSALAGALTAAAVAVSAYGLYQVAVEFPQMHEAYRRNPEEMLRRVGIDPDSPARRSFQDRLIGSNEPYATFALANSLAGFLLGPTAVGLALALENLSGHRGRGSRFVALASAAAPGLILLASLLLTKSRSAYLGLLVALIVLIARRRRLVSARVLGSIVAGLALVLLTMVVAAVATGHLDREVLTEASKSLRYRAEYWAGAWRVIRDEPGAFWHGVGPGNFAAPYLSHKLARASEEIRDPHNLVLEVWATAGLWAALALVAAVILAMRDLLGPGDSARSDEEESGASSPTAAASDDPPARAGWLIASAGGSWLLVVLLGRLDPFDVDADLLPRWLILGGAWGMAVLLGLPLWTRRPIPADGPGVAAMAVLVNLLAAGGIGIPSVALGLWCWVALGQNLRDDRACGRPRVARGRGPAFVLAMAWAMLVGSYVGAVVPFRKGEAEMAEAEAALRARPPQFEQARDAYSRAGRLDKLAVGPWLALADLEYQYWISRGARADDPIWKMITPTLDQAAKRDPRSLDIQRRRAAIAEDFLTLHGADLPISQVVQLQAQVVAASRVAARLYPTSARLRAQLAKASAALGDRGAAIEEAREALRLDAITPHADKKLPDAVRDRIKADLSRWSRAREAD